MDFSEFLHVSTSKDGKEHFTWTGSRPNGLANFLSDLGFTGTWSQPNGNGRPHKFKPTKKNFTCTCYETKTTLLIQGTEREVLEHKFKQYLRDPTCIPLAAAEDESETESTAIEAEGTGEVNEDDIPDGVNPGKVIADLLKFKMKKWNREGAKVTIATPFMDCFGLLVIKSCLDNEVLDKVYTREVCAWEKKKIDEVIAEADLSENWIISKVVAFKTKPSFHAKFLAGEYKDKVELIVTSCNMTLEHLDSVQLETVIRTERAVETFHSHWLKPLEEMAKRKESTIKFLTEFLNMDDMNQEVQNIE